MPLTPVLLATWINVCLPQADPAIVHAMATVGSGSDPLVVMDGAGQKLTGSKEVELAAAIKASPADKELYIGLIQVPRSSLRQLGIPADMALDTCTNLKVGYQLYSEARDYAATVEKTPKKLLAVSFNYYRSKQKNVDGPYATAAVAAVEKPTMSPPAPFGSRLYMTLSAQATASTARLMMLSAGALHQTGAATSRAAVVRLSSLY